METVFLIIMMFLSFVAGILFGYFNRDEQEEYDYDQGYMEGWCDAFEIVEESSREEGRK